MNALGDCKVGCALCLILGAFFAPGQLNGTPDAPVALWPADMTAVGFTIRWQGVEGAAGYLLDLWRYSGVPPATLCQGFDAYPDLEPEGWEIVNATKAADKVYTSSSNYGAAAPSLKLSADGHSVASPEAPAAITSLGFWMKGQSSGESTLLLEGYAGAWQTIRDFAIPTSQVNAQHQVPLESSSDYRRVRLSFERDKGGVGIDDICISYGSAAPVYLLQQQAVYEAHDWPVANLEPGVYYYALRAFSANATSELSNVIQIDTLAEPQPPLIEALTGQEVRIGQSLSLVLPVVATEGDPVLQFAGEALTDVAGAWSLEEGIFNYAPSAQDLGEQRFSFKARDKDGWSAAAVLLVEVLPALIEAIAIDSACGSHFENFNALAGEGGPHEWQNAYAPLPAWYAFCKSEPLSSYRVGDGSSSTQGIYAFDDDGNRALGSLAAGGNTYYYGVAFTNASGVCLTNLAFSVRTSQRRVGASVLPNTLVCEYCVTNAVIALPAGIWHRIPALCYEATAVTNQERQAGSILVEEHLHASIRRAVPSGGVLLLRWLDVDDTSNDHAFAIDDFKLEWTGGELQDGIPVGLKGLRENFDEMGSNAPLELPWQWRIGMYSDSTTICGSYSEASPRVAVGTPVANFSSEGSYSFPCASKEDIAVGGLPGKKGACSIVLMSEIRNLTGSRIRRWQVGYQVEQYRRGSIATAVTLLQSRDGSSWSEAGTPLVVAADAQPGAVPQSQWPVETWPVTGELCFEEGIASGESFFLGWRIATAAENAAEGNHALGIDEITLVPQLPRTMLLLIR